MFETWCFILGVIVGLLAHALYWVLRLRHCPDGTINVKLEKDFEDELYYSFKIEFDDYAQMNSLIDFKEGDIACLRVTKGTQK